MSCPLCGRAVEGCEEGVVCSACPLVTACKMRQCAFCGYTWIDESRLATWLHRQWRLWRYAPDHQHPA